MKQGHLSIAAGGPHVAALAAIDKALPFAAPHKATAEGLDDGSFLGAASWRLEEVMI